MQNNLWQLIVKSDTFVPCTKADVITITRADAMLIPSSSMAKCTKVNLNN